DDAATRGLSVVVPPATASSVPTAVTSGDGVGGEFRLLARLAPGGGGVVYKGHQIGMDRDVALKELAPEFAADAEFVARFYREAQMSVRLDHPNIVRGIRVFAERGSHYFAMDLIDGDSLQQRLERPGGFSIGET